MSAFMWRVARICVSTPLAWERDAYYAARRMIGWMVPSSSRPLGCACSMGQHQAGLRWPGRPEPMIVSSDVLGPTVPAGTVVVHCVFCGVETDPLPEADAIKMWDLMTLRRLRSHAMGPGF